MPCDVVSVVAPFLENLKLLKPVKNWFPVQKTSYELFTIAISVEAPHHKSNKDVL
jgi:hypothetical protein